MTSRRKGNPVPEQIVLSAERLLARGGLSGASLNAIAAESEVPRGSVLYYFPEGKEQIVEAALRAHDEMFSARMDEVLVPGKDFVKSVVALMEGTAKKMKAQGYVSGCPVAGVVLDLGDEDEELRRACQQIVEGWEAVMARGLTELPASKRRDAGEFIFAAYEGAIMMARLKKSTAPLVNAARHIALVLRALC